MITFKNKGNWKKSFNFLDKIINKKHIMTLEKYGEQGVLALSANTPVDSGKTATSWQYEIQKRRNGYKIVWSNSNIINDKGSRINVAILIQYGHATKDGKWVEGIDYINPSLAPIFENMADDIWKEVTDL